MQKKNRFLYQIPSQISTIIQNGLRMDLRDKTYPTVSNGVPRCPTLSHVVPRCPTLSHVVPRRPTVSHGVPRCPTASHGVRRRPTVSHGVPRCPTASHGVPRRPTVSNGVPRCSPVWIIQNSFGGFWRSKPDWCVVLSLVSFCKD